MSAFAALKSLDSMASILQDDVDDSDQIIGYLKNSSDDDVDEDVDEEDVIREGARSNPLPTVSPVPQFKRPGGFIPIFESNFTPNEDNFLVNNSGKEIIIGLKQGEYLVVNGQADLKIQRGAILINNCHYHYAHPDHSYRIIASQSQSLPIIASAQVLDRSCGILDSKTVDNEHLFHSDYKSVITLSSLETGLEDIGKYCPPLKRFFYNKNDEEQVQLESSISFLNHPDVEYLRNFSFEIVLDNKGMTGLSLDRSWVNKIKELSRYDENDTSSTITLVIGNKNSGKSTFSKSLLNNFFVDGNREVSYLDLDPGQSEFSDPYCLSISSYKRPIFGINIDKGNKHGLTEYYGFTSPQLQPNLYLAIIKKLFRFYQEHQSGNHLIINTPGWIKGLGKELLESITIYINPTHLVYLNGLGILLESNVEADATLEGLTFQNLHVLPGMYQVSKYSPAQLRTFNKLIYFHKNESTTSPSYNFNSHLLHTAPIKISYQTDPNDHNFSGVNAVSVSNFDVSLQFDHNDLLLMVDSSIAGIYLIENEQFFSNKFQLGAKLPLYINSTDFFNETVSHGSYLFMGLCMIHSVNKEKQYFNVYFPEGKVVIKLKEMIKVGGYKLVLVKGDGDIPSQEILMPELVQQQISSLKKLKKSNSNVQDMKKMPYVSFIAGNKVGGVWKIRRNIMRRSHRQR